MLERWVDAVVSLLERLPSGVMKTIAVDGHSAAGKSTFTAELFDRLGAVVVAGDDFYRVMPGEQRAKLSPREGVGRYFGNVVNEVLRAVAAHTDPPR